MIGLLDSLPPVSGRDTDWDSFGPMLGEAFSQTLCMACIAMLTGGVADLAIDVLLYTTHDDGVLHSKFVCQALNVLINFVRPILFITLATVIGSLTKNVVGAMIGTEAVMFVMLIAATFAIACLVEQSLMSIDPGAVKAARAMGVSSWRIIHTAVVPEVLGPLALGYTFAFIAVIDTLVVTGHVGGGGLGNFAITYGYQAFGWSVILVTTLVIIFTVQLVQTFGNWLSKKIMRR